jgi:hypothetical protein
MITAKIMLAGLKEHFNLEHGQWFFPMDSGCKFLLPFLTLNLRDFWPHFEQRSLVCQRLHYEFILLGMRSLRSIMILS